MVSYSGSPASEASSTPMVKQQETTAGQVSLTLNTAQVPSNVSFTNGNPLLGSFYSKCFLIKKHWDLLQKDKPFSKPTQILV